jgi:hypothetical protein
LDLNGYFAWFGRNQKLDEWGENEEWTWIIGKEETNTITEQMVETIK